MPSTPLENPRPSVSDTMSADERTLYEPSDNESYDGRPSAELSDGDHDILESEDERERLLTKNEGVSGLFGKKGIKIGKRDHNAPTKIKTKGRRKGNDESSALMYEMEEGVGASASSLSRGSSESADRPMLATTSHKQVCRQLREARKC